MGFFGPRDTQAVNSFNDSASAFAKQREADDAKAQLDKVGKIVFNYIENATEEQKNSKDFMGKLIPVLKGQGFSMPSIISGINLAGAFTAARNKQGKANNEQTTLDRKSVV